MLKNKNFWIFLMLIIALTGLFFKIYALLLIPPIGFTLGKKSNK